MSPGTSRFGTPGQLTPLFHCRRHRD